MAHFTLLFGLMACGSSPGGPAETTAGGSRSSEPEQSPAFGGEAHLPRDTRTLGREASFGELVEAARTLDDRRQDTSEAECVLREPNSEENHWRLEADVAVAVRPFPDAPSDLDEIVDGTTGAVRVLTRFGTVGADSPEVVLAAFTAAQTPTADAAVLFVTDRGVYIRSSAAPVRPSEAAVLRLDVLQERLPPALPSSISGVFVTAESSIGLVTIARVLRAIPSELQPSTALAVALPEGTRLPRTAPVPASSAARSDLCEGGLPPPARDASEGQLAAASMRTTIQAASEPIGRCIATNPNPRFEPSVLEAALRIGADGRVQTACATADAANDATLRACVLGVLRTLSFDTPHPRGFVDVAFPLVLEPRAPSHARLLCDS